ncbi:bifunctional proline dehydrogenase/L-glutamate gamma-semialdehyde dehydrogenase PutA [Rhodobium gokarnense]|uniref:Bifunctional protein PutA n=1 Tax=Rhodobium gokarnense TaxID=364296 RepID=A0ABT3H8S9_9HYPH|nr:bifunctional proline dehydrogenase/L-glutamate gamma-semialdehyde dehydrogenase PutA [Rhodobium gokarnense]MCW2306808.1 RHH-type proline utilization regulon transcriptional repressor/proline dehydrogenase/delta 1-pyrroline-5-carboxylate dehydrogenase [Rhodobium gokarnense]
MSDASSGAAPSPVSASDPSDLAAIRQRMREAIIADEAETMRALAAATPITEETRKKIAARGAELVAKVRSSSKPTMMESFLAEFGLSTREGVALMCLAEALLRVPDDETIDALISDKIAPSDWSTHLGQSSSVLVNASTWALMLTGHVLTDKDGQNVAKTVRGMIRRLGEPVVRVAVGQTMKELGRQFVLGRNIHEAIARAKKREAAGYCYSYDMLGEAALTEADARRHHLSYSNAITELAASCGPDIRANPGVSVKLSALHPRYEFAKRERVMTELVARTRALALIAKSANMGFNIDAEEMDRLDLSLDVFEAVLSDPALAGWDGMGIVVQAYAKRAPAEIDWLHALATKLDRKIMVRLVKGAYWDSEVKIAQTEGLPGYPVYTRKVNSDVCYLVCAQKLLSMSERIYPQFASHNAHSVASILEMADGKTSFEFQRLHGMGESLYDTVKKSNDVRCRIYAPVGEHRDLLAYLVRRLLENGANSSFVNQIVDEEIPPEEVARDPFAVLEAHGQAIANPRIPLPPMLYGEARRNAKGWDLTDPLELDELFAARDRFAASRWHAAPMVAGQAMRDGGREMANPAKPGDVVGTVVEASQEDLAAALSAAAEGFSEWSARSVDERASALERVADLYEENAPEFFALCAREAGKTLNDAVAEVREAVDFLRYYASEARRLEGEAAGSGRGVFACISPWNFPLAIFTGQISAALAAGNAVIAKPAEQTPLIAARAVALMCEAGIPEAAIQLLPGDGPTVGAPLAADPRIAGVCFTGSTEVAQRINRSMSETLAPSAPLIAETGGLNAMIVDSSALPEQAVGDILASAFQSAGQRCSALRILYVQEDVEDRIMKMLSGAMDELELGDPWKLQTDIGPVIDDEARDTIEGYCRQMEADGKLIKKLSVPGGGRFVAPTVIKVSGIEEMEREIFGPVLHVATFPAEGIDDVIDAVNAKGYGLTFGLHTRVDSRVQQVVDRLHVGNLYVNRNQIGAIVGSQPFGGEGLSGTGPKAGGPHYVARFMRRGGEAAGAAAPDAPAPAPEAKTIDAGAVQAALDKLDTAVWAGREDRAAVLGEALSRSGAPASDALEAATGIAATMDLPGPTGESNRLSFPPRGRVLCLGPDLESLAVQTVQALAAGNAVVAVAPGAPGFVHEFASRGAPIAGLDGAFDAAAVGTLTGIGAVAATGDGSYLAALRQALAGRHGAILPLITELVAPERYVLERHLCIDTTAAGGNASLLAASGS